MSIVVDGLMANKLFASCPMDGRKRVAWNLRRIRVGLDLSQESLTFDAGVDRGYISGIERESFNATIDVLDRLATVLKIDVARLLDPIDAEMVQPKPLKNGRRLSRSARKPLVLDGGRD